MEWRDVLRLIGVSMFCTVANVARVVLFDQAPMSAGEVITISIGTVILMALREER